MYSFTFAPAFEKTISKDTIKAWQKVKNGKKIPSRFFEKFFNDEFEILIEILPLPAAAEKAVLKSQKTFF